MINMGVGEAVKDSKKIEVAIKELAAISGQKPVVTKSKKANQDAKKHRLSLIFFTLGLLLIIAMIPWPFRGEIARSLWP